MPTIAILAILFIVALIVAALLLARRRKPVNSPREAPTSPDDVLKSASFDRAERELNEQTLEQLTEQHE